MRNSALLAVTLAVLTAQSPNGAAIMAPESGGGIEQELTTLNDALLRDLASDIGGAPLPTAVVRIGRDAAPLSTAEYRVREAAVIERLNAQVSVEPIDAATPAPEFSAQRLTADLRRAGEELSRQLAIAFNVTFHLAHEPQRTAAARRQACAC
jgi:hypothetical protein